MEGEIEIFSKLFIDPISVLHPFTMLPLIGMGCIGQLLFFMFVLTFSRDSKVIFLIVKKDKTGKNKIISKPIDLQILLHE